MRKTLLLLPTAFVLGGLVGYWGPSADLRELKSRAEETKAKAAPSNGFGSFAHIVNIPEVADPKRMHRRTRTFRPSEPQDESQAANAVVAETQAEASSAGDAEATPGREGRQKPQLSPEDLRARIDEAADLWRARADIARAKACEQLSLDEEGQARFEETLDGMNERLRESIQTIADLLEEQESLTPELGVRLMGDLSTTLAETYDAVGACAGEDMRGEVSRLNLADFVDPSVAEPLIAVQGKLDGGFSLSGRRAK